MDDLTPSFERGTGQVILEGLRAGAAGEAPLVPVPGLDLAFDRADGRLCRAVVHAAGTDGHIAVGEQVAAILVQLFGAEAPSVVSEPAGARTLSPEAGLTATLSSLARLDAARATSPIPPGSPWWADEAAELAERAGLQARARTEAAVAAADLSGSRLAGPALDVAAEVASLEKDRVRLAGLQWMLDPDLVPEGLFRPGLSPYSEPCRLPRRREGTGNSRGAAGAGSGYRRTRPLPGQARGPVGPPDPGPGGLHRDTVQRPGRAPASVPAGRSTRELDRGGTGQTLARSQR